MLDNIENENILFLDIETVPLVPVFDKLSDNFQTLWSAKTKYLQEKENKTASELYERAGIYSEFGKIICISVGVMVNKDGKKLLRIKSFADDNEAKLLTEFSKLLNKKFNAAHHYMCAHNGKEFDYPYIARRMLINRMKIPKLLDIAGKKPWEVRHLDTLELWKFGDYKHYTSLNLLTAIFDIPTPKDDINGADVAKVYWQDKDLPRIVIYCQKDVLALAQLFLRYKNEDLILDENVEIV